jgi:excinuclease ABC subunit C
MTGFDPRNFSANLPRRPGVYRMFDRQGGILYVGKARNLRDRVSSYFAASNVAPKTQLLVRDVASIEVTVTNSDTEALLLEYNLIKQHKPRFNVVLRDDKSFPYVYLNAGHVFPRLSLYRGPRNQPGRYFGPFPSPLAVKDTLQQLQKLFRIRNCRDTFFANRSRPCLQHQIGRCSAPCVGLIGQDEYGRDLEAAIQVLEGRSDEVNRVLEASMEQAATTLDFERAAELRDRLAALKRIQAQQIVVAEGEADLDVLAIVGEAGEYAVSLMLVRAGRNLGTTGFFPRAALAEPGEALASFMMQHYATQPPPPEILVNLDLDDAAALGEALSARVPGTTVRVRRPSRGLPARWIEMNRENAEHALRMRQARRQGVEAMFMSLAQELGLSQVPTRLECFDISHTGGEGTVASCVVFDQDGPVKKEYRRFNISGISPGDDYAALRQALERRYTRIQRGEFARPDVLFIDGGAGQVNAVHAALTELGFEHPLLVGVAKGVNRRPGQERLFVHGESGPRAPSPEAPALRLIQRIRDEAHRFAIAGHRRRRARRFNESVLEAVPGLGPAKRRALLRHFGGIQGVLRAGAADFEQVAGIGTALARTLYDHLHPGA